VHESRKHGRQSRYERQPKRHIWSATVLRQEGFHWPRVRLPQEVCFVNRLKVLTVSNLDRNGMLDPMSGGAGLGEQTMPGPGAAMDFADMARYLQPNFKHIVGSIA